MKWGVSLRLQTLAPILDSCARGFIVGWVMDTIFHSTYIGLVGQSTRTLNLEGIPVIPPKEEAKELEKNRPARECKKRTRLGNRQSHGFFIRGRLSYPPSWWQRSDAENLLRCVMPRSSDGPI